MIGGVILRQAVSKLDGGGDSQGGVIGLNPSEISGGGARRIGHLGIGTVSLRVNGNLINLPVTRGAGWSGNWEPEAGQTSTG